MVMSRLDKPDALKAGDIAPPFTLADPSGVLISSADLLRKGPLVVTFYRGMWCLYCRLDLQALEAAVTDVHSYGASLVAISHQSAGDSRRRFQLVNHISFPLLDDKGGEVAIAFGIRWVPGDRQSVHEWFSADLDEDVSWILPMQARYVIGQDGVIAYANINSEYTRRPEPSEILPVLRRLKIGSRAGEASTRGGEG
jgi:peroxiredoxin